MYDQGKIWDLTPDGGGPPMQVVVGNPNEAISRHPDRYSRTPPDGTAQAELAKRRDEERLHVAEIEKEKRERLEAIAKERQAALDEIAKKEAEDVKAAQAKKAEDDKKAAEEAGVVPSRDGEKQAIEAHADAAAELAQHEASLKIAARPPGQPDPVLPAPPVAPQFTAEQQRAEADRLAAIKAQEAKS